jgi:hypothetical protein
LTNVPAILFPIALRPSKLATSAKLTKTASFTIDWNEIAALRAAFPTV